MGSSPPACLQKQIFSLLQNYWFYPFSNLEFGRYILKTNSQTKTLDTSSM